MASPALRHVDSPPQADAFTPLHEHQAQTPSTFFGGKPVLYKHQNGLTLSAQASRLAADPLFAKFVTTPGDATQDVFIPDIELWASDDALILFQHTPIPTGVAIPYPSIALHATMKWQSTPGSLPLDALLINISCNDADSVNDENDIQTLEVIVLPPACHSSNPEVACIKDIYAALNTCADLHPDPNSSEAEDDEEEDLSAPGASGWITAENMDEYLDEDGNFRGGIDVIGGPSVLGPGAGTVRTRENGDEDHVNQVDGVDDTGHENKYYRTD